MSRELPFPIAFALPPGWELVSPDSCGQPDAACVAIRTANANDPIATNFVISGFPYEGQAADIVALATANLTALQSRYPVTVLKDELINRGPAPEVAQLLQIEIQAGESAITVKQIRIVNVFPSTEVPNTHAVLQLVMTCPAEVFTSAGPEFGQFIKSIEPRG